MLLLTFWIFVLANPNASFILKYLWPIVWLLSYFEICLRPIVWLFTILNCVKSLWKYSSVLLTCLSCLFWLWYLLSFWVDSPTLANGCFEGWVGGALGLWPLLESSLYIRYTRHTRKKLANNWLRNNFWSLLLQIRDPCL